MSSKKKCTPDDCIAGPSNINSKNVNSSNGPSDKCVKNVCPSLPPVKEEKEIQATDLCNDPGCSNVHEKKLVDMRQGLNELETILKVMTGLCKEPKCPSNAPEVQTKIAASATPLPVPNKYAPEKIPVQTTQPERDDDSRIPTNYKTCRGNVCYNKYMGYKIEPMVREQKIICGSQTCIPKKIPTDIKTPCSGTICPFGDDKKSSGVKPDLYGFGTPKTTTMGPCGGFSCGFSNDNASPPAFKSRLADMSKNNLYTDLKPTYLPPTNTGYSGLTSGFTGGITSDLTSSLMSCPKVSCGADNKAASPTPVGLCGRTSCPYASIEFAQKLEEIKNQFCGDPACPFSALKSKFCGDLKCTAKPRVCGDPVCPSTSQKESVCGNPTCPYIEQKKDDYVNPCCQNKNKESEDKIGLCGRNDCPYASMGASIKQTGLCGSPDCGMMSKTSPGGIKPCPYADRIKRYPCGSPSCPYVNPSGILHTHEYSYDKSYVQEAARPYCGSASPYDYMSSITPTYPSPYATNFPLFSYTEPAKLPPCPYMPKKPRQSCGMKECPYSDQARKQQKDNFCIDHTCPYGEGVCGGPRKFCCDNPEVNPCGSPDCKAPTRKRKKDDGGKGRSTCCHCGGPISSNQNEDMDDDDDSGACGGPKKFCCDSPNVEHCRSPECPVHRKPKKKKRKGTCCLMTDSSRQDDEEGICGGPKKFSCESPLVVHCRTVECKVPAPKDDDWCRRPDCRPKQKGGRSGGDGGDSSTSDSEGACGKKKFSCDSPTVEDCTSPDCPYHHKKKKEKRSKCCRMARMESAQGAQGAQDDQDGDEGICGGPKKFSCDNPEVIPCNSPDCKAGISGSGDRGKCSSKTCPFLKKLIFCDDCGGVLPGDESSSFGSSEDLDETAAERPPSTPVDGEEQKETQIMTKRDIFEQVFDEKNLKLVKTVSLYSYPGVQIGHNDCSYRRRLVPRNMGWLWNRIPCFGNPEFWRGYKPGAILRSVYKIIKKHRKEADIFEGKKKRSRSRMRIMDLKHCIEVKKKEGDYTITVNPVKDPKTRGPMDSPYFDVTPIQYKIEKESKSQKDGNYCPCDDDAEQKSEASTEFDFHFTPPAAIPDIMAKKKKNRKEVEIQYDLMDLPPELRSSKKGGKGKGEKGEGGGGKKKGKKKK